MKIAAFDFDGTLHHSTDTDTGEHGFDPADMAAIQAWRDAGHIAISATGRSRTALEFGMRHCPIRFDYQVLSNGGSATTGDNERLLYSHLVDPEIVEQVVTHFADTDGVAVFGTTIGHVDGEFSSNTQARSSFTVNFDRMTTADIPHHEFAVVPLWIPGNEALRAEVYEWTRALPHVSVAQNQDFIDIMAPGRTKGAGIQDLLQLLDVPREDIELYTFGDSWNDLSMHEIADHSHSFRHSPAEVQQRTDHVINRVADVLPSYI